MFSRMNPIRTNYDRRGVPARAALACTVILGCALLGCGDKKNSSAESSRGSESKSPEAKASKQETVENPPPSLTVAATVLGKEYKADSAAADKKYKGQWIAVEGVAEGVEVMEPLAGFSKNEAVLVLSGADNAIVRCECLMAETDKAIRISKGQKLKVIGKCTGSDVPPVVGIEQARIDQTDKDPAVVTSLETLLGDYLKDEKSADAKYKNKIVSITGTGGVLKNNQGLDCIVFPGSKGKSGEPVPVSCYFLPGWKYRLKKIAPNSTISIKGYCSGLSGSEGVVLGSSALLP